MEAYAPPTLAQIETKIADLPRGSLTDRSTCSTTRSEYGRDPNRRVCPELTLEQEEALMGLMYDNFMKNDCKMIEYERAVRCALSLQCDPRVCSTLCASAVTIEKAWVPDEAWLTDMVFVFQDAYSQLTARSKPASSVTPNGIAYVVEMGNMAMHDNVVAPAVIQSGPLAANPAINVGPAPTKKGKKKDKAHALSDAELLADPRPRRPPSPKPTGRAASPKKSKKKKKSDISARSGSSQSSA
jgi:hypothetical protein